MKRSVCVHLPRPSATPLLDGEVRLGRLAGAAVDRQDVLRTGREGDDEIHLRSKQRVAPGGGHRLAPGEAPVGRPGDVHEEVQRRWRRRDEDIQDRKSTRLNSSHSQISYAVFCLKKKITIY